jgi:hypothetical protein
MTFEEILDQAIAMLQRRGRLTYSTLKLQFQLEDEQLAVLRDELLYSQPHVVDDAGRGLVWTGAPGTTPAAPAAPVETPARVPLGLRSPHRPLSATQNNWHNPKLLCSQWVRCFHLGQESLGWPTP